MLSCCSRDAQPVCSRMNWKLAPGATPWGFNSETSESKEMGVVSLAVSHHSLSRPINSSAGNHHRSRQPLFIPNRAAHRRTLLTACCTTGKVKKETTSGCSLACSAHTARAQGRASDEQIQICLSLEKLWKCRLWFLAFSERVCLAFRVLGWTPAWQSHLLGRDFKEKNRYIIQQRWLSGNYRKQRTIFN